jgi:hypothetical protein
MAGTGKDRTDFRGLHGSVCVSPITLFLPQRPTATLNAPVPRYFRAWFSSIVGPDAFTVAVHAFAVTDWDKGDLAQ